MCVGHVGVTSADDHTLPRLCRVVFVTTFLRSPGFECELRRLEPERKLGSAMVFGAKPYRRTVLHLAHCKISTGTWPLNLNTGASYGRRNTVLDWRANSGGRPNALERHICRTLQRVLSVVRRSTRANAPRPGNGNRQTDYDRPHFERGTQPIRQGVRSNRGGRSTLPPRWEFTDDLEGTLYDCH